MVQGEVQNYDIRNDDPWSRVTLVVLALIIIGLAYLLKVILQQQYNEFKRRRAEWKMEQRLLKNSSCKRISTREFNDQKDTYTKNQLQKLYNSPEYQQYLKNREDLVLPEINEELEYHTDSDHEKLMEELQNIDKEFSHSKVRTRKQIAKAMNTGSVQEPLQKLLNRGKAADSPNNDIKHSSVFEEPSQIQKKYS